MRHGLDRELNRVGANVVPKKKNRQRGRDTFFSAAFKRASQKTYDVEFQAVVQLVL